MYKSKYFKTKDLVSPEIYEELGEAAINLISEKLLITIDILYEICGNTLVCNTWLMKGYIQHNGVTKNDPDHKFGSELDFTSYRFNIKMLFEMIEKNKDLFPYTILVKKTIDKHVPKALHVRINTRNLKNKLVFYDCTTRKTQKWTDYL